MYICYLCKKSFYIDQIIKLRNSKYVCKECIKTRESILTNISLEKIILESKKNKLNSLHDKITFYLGLIIIIFFTLLIHDNIKPYHVFILLFSFIIWAAFSIPIKYKNKKILLEIEKIKEKEIEIVAKTKKDLEEIYEQFYPVPPDWGERRIKVYNREKGICQNCRIKINGTYHVHHNIPKSKKEGNHGLDNLILLCPECHSKIDSIGHKMINPRKKKLRKS